MNDKKLISDKDLKKLRSLQDDYFTEYAVAGEDIKAGDSFGINPEDGKAYRRLLDGLIVSRYTAMQAYQDYQEGDRIPFYQATGER